MAACATKHPDQPDLACILPRSERGHRWHLALYYVEGTSRPESVHWPESDYRSAQDMRDEARRAKVLVETSAATVRAEIAANTPTVPLGSKPGQRKKIRLGQVANMLANNVGVWIDGYRLETVEIGGSSGLRRVRELHDDYGWNIIKRPTTNSTHQYCLVELPDEFKDNE